MIHFLSNCKKCGEEFLKLLDVKYEKTEKIYFCKCSKCGTKKVEKIKYENPSKKDSN